MSPYPDEDWVVQAIENNFYRPVRRKKPVPEYIQRIRREKAKERNQLSSRIKKEIKLGVRCRHGVQKEKCIVCDPKYKPEKIDVDTIPF